MYKVLAVEVYPEKIGRPLPLLEDDCFLSIEFLLFLIPDIGQWKALPMHFISRL